MYAGGESLGRRVRSHLPKYPKVEARGNAVIIIDEDGEEHFWGIEDNESTAATVAEDIQLGLRAIHYVRKNLQTSLMETMEFLKEVGVPSEHLDDIIYEGYQSIHKWINKLSQARTR